MLFRIYLILTVLVVALFFYLSTLNQESVSIKLSEKSVHELPVTLLLLVTLVSGFVLGRLVSFVKWLNTAIRNLKTSRQRKAAKTTRTLLAEAKKALLLGNGKKSEDLLNRCISMSPDDAEPYILLINRYLDTGKADDASKLLESIPSSLDDDTEVLVTKTKVFMALEDFDRAAEILRKVSEREKDRDAKRLLRDIYMRAGKWDRAADIQEELRQGWKKEEDERESATSARIGYEIAKKMADEGKVDDAAQKLSELVKKWPGYAPLHVLLGEIQWDSGERELAEEAWRKGFEKTKNMIFLFLLEDRYLSEEAPQKIIDLYKALIIDDPDNLLLHLFLGKLFLRLEMIDDALESLARAKEFEPESTYLSKLIGEALFRKGNFREAAENFKDALRFKRRLLIPFQCSSCHRQSYEWKALCPGCGAWDSLAVAVKPDEGEWLCKSISS